MREDHYEICDSDGIFRMPRERLGALFAELFLVDFIHRIEAQAEGPLIIIRRSLEDNDQEDPVLRILSRYGIEVDLRDNRMVRHHLCHSQEQVCAAIERSSERLGTDISSPQPYNWKPL